MEKITLMGSLMTLVSEGNRTDGRSLLFAGCYATRIEKAFKSKALKDNFSKAIGDNSNGSLFIVSLVAIESHRQSQDPPFDIPLY